MTDTPEPGILVEDDDVPVVNSALDAPTFFVDNLINLSSMGGVVKLYFIENLADAAEKTFQARYAVTIAMTQNTLVNLSAYLQTTLADMRKQGVLDGGDQASE